jgi:hypothetical protein
MTHAFETLRVLRVCLHTDARNQRSRAAIERIGGRFEGILRAHRMVADYTPPRFGPFFNRCDHSLGTAYAVSGMRDETAKMLNDLKNRSPQAFSNAPEIAMVYVGLDEKDQAMAWLEKAYAERFSPWVLMRPCFNPMRSDPRFQDLLRLIL